MIILSSLLRAALSPTRLRSFLKKLEHALDRAVAHRIQHAVPETEHARVRREIHRLSPRSADSRQS